MSLCFVKKSRCRYCRLVSLVLRVWEVIIYRLMVLKRPVADPQNTLGKPVWVHLYNCLPVDR